MDRSGGIDPARYSKIRIMGNVIEARGQTSLGILLLCDKGVVGFNEIKMGAPGTKGVGILTGGSEGLIARNRIMGSGSFALSTMMFPPFKGCGNTLVQNDVSAFNPSVAHVSFKGNDNFVEGRSCKVMDQGKNNRILVGD